MAWLFLTLAALFEIAFATSMKASEGFTRLWPSIVTVFGVAGGIGFLTLSMRTLPVSIAYPAWVGAGALGTVVLGALWFGETLSVLKLASTLAILAGVIGLKLSAST
jgi:quaternary ammonium compound-resistance protein SugE